MLIPSAYFGSIDYFSHLWRNASSLHDEDPSHYSFIDEDERYCKQTFRSRCRILTANGVQMLTVPVIHTHERARMKDILVSTHHDWQHQHWTALVSAYGKSPFFEFYEDDLRPIFLRGWKYLLDLNNATTDIAIRMLNLCNISPKAVPLLAEKRTYYQTHRQMIGSQSDLSILDLLFNMGNESVFYL